MIQAVVFARVHAHAVLFVAIPFLPGRIAEGLILYGDGLLDRQVIFLGKPEVAFVMRRHRHHRAFAVAHQHIVADPYRHLFAGERVGHLDTGVHALLFHGGDVRFGHAALLAFFDECGELGIVLCGLGRQRMLRRHGDEGHAHDGVGARGVHPQLLVIAVQS